MLQTTRTRLALIDATKVLDTVVDQEVFEVYTAPPIGNIVERNLGALTGAAAGIIQGPRVGNATIKQQADIAPATPGTLTTTAIATNVSGSAFLVGLARGNWSNTNSPATKTPSDSPGNALAGVIGPNSYAGFPDSQQALYYTLAPAGVGSATHTTSASYGLNPGATVHDEQTQFLIEIIGADVMATSSYVEQVGATTVTSNTVTVSSGPCLLIAVVWGTGGTGVSHVFTSTSGMTKISGASAETDFNSNGYIQCSTFWQYQGAPGTFTASFQGQNTEGAAIYLVAFQAGNQAQISLDALTLSAAGSVASAGGATGDLSATLGVVTDTATGAVAVQGAESTTLGTLTDSAAATVSVQGAASDTLGAVTSSSTAAVAVQGASTKTLGTLTDTAAAAVAVQGAASDVLGAVTGGGAGSAAVQGASTDTLGSVTTSGSGAVAAQGAAAGALGSVTNSGAGAVAVQGDGASTLGSLTDTATGAVGTSGDASDTLGGLTGFGTGSAAISGDASDTLGATTASGDGSVAVQGSASDTLGAVTTSSDGTVEDAGAAHGDLSATLGEVSTDATGSVAVSGDLSQPLGGVGESGAGAVAISGDASPTLGDVASSPPNLPPLTGGGGGGYWPTYKKEAKTRLIRSAREQHGATVTVWVLEGPSDSTQSFTSGSRIQFIASFRRNGEDWDYDVSATVSDSRGEKPQVVHRVSRGVYYIEIKVTTGVITVRFTTPDGADSETTYLVTPALAGRAAGPVSTPDARVDGESWKSYYRRLGKRGR